MPLPARTTSRRFLSSTLLVALALGLPLVAAGSHVEIEPGRVYAGGTPLRVGELGLTFTVPGGWRGLLPPGAEAFVLQPEGDPETTILGVGDQGTRAELAAEMSAPVDLGDGIVLVPEGEVGERGRALTGRYRVTGSPKPLGAYAEALAGPNGATVAYVLIAAPGSLRSHEAAVHALTDSSAFEAPPASDGATAQAGGGTGAGSGANDRWDTYLEGKYIVRYYTTSGYTDEQHLWLCSNGTFHRKGAAGGFGGGASGAFQSNADGRWSATGAGEHGVLTLHYPDGSTVPYELRWDYAQNHLYVDGKRWLHGENEVCD